VVITVVVITVVGGMAAVAGTVVVAGITDEPVFQLRETRLQLAEGSVPCQFLIT
jgi:hypothetical protein